MNLAKWITNIFKKLRKDKKADTKSSLYDTNKPIDQ
jgi:hypothetical protein